MSRSLIEFIDSTIVSVDRVERFRRTFRLTPDEWQEDFLSSQAELLLALCSRQIGKTAATSILAYDTVTRGDECLIMAPAERQSKLMLKRILFALRQDPYAPAVVRSTQTELECVNGGTVYCVPQSSDTIRGFSAIALLVLEECGFLTNDAIESILPARAEDGRVVAITTPGNSRDCFFNDVWESGEAHTIKARSVDQDRLRKKVAFDK